MQQNVPQIQERIDQYLREKKHAARKAKVLRLYGRCSPSIFAGIGLAILTPIIGTNCIE